VTWVWVDADPERIAQALAALGLALIGPKGEAPEADPQAPGAEPPSRTGPPSVYQVQEAVSRVWGLTIYELQSPLRTPRVSLPRQVAMYLLRDVCHLRLLEIAQAFGRRDHSTVIYAVEKIARKLRTDPELRAQVYQAKNLLRTMLIQCGSPGENGKDQQPEEDLHNINRDVHTPDGASTTHQAVG
jgi:hypothetical protein